MGKTKECEACEGTGHIITQERGASWWDDGLELTPCVECDAIGVLVDDDATHDTLRAPPPDFEAA